MAKIAKTQEEVREHLQASTEVDVETGCWNWLMARSHSGEGYGLVYHDGKVQSAHRVSYELFNGSIPEGLWVRHKCHNKQCCNPEHLELGTPKENFHDSYETSVEAVRMAAEVRRKPKPIPTMVLRRRELTEALEDSRMPTELRTAAEMFAGGMGYEEIAEELSTPVGTIRSRIHRARKYARVIEST